MTDLEILAKFRQAEAAGTLIKLTKSTHVCQTTGCDTCIAKSACRAIIDSGKTYSFDTNYRNWAKRTTLLSLSELQQHYPEHLL